MPTFIQLLNYTQEGIDRIDELPERLEEARANAEAMGGEITDFYLTLGRYDAAVVVEVPDAESAAIGAITQAQEGTIETETLRAFDEDEAEEIVRAVAE